MIYVPQFPVPLNLLTIKADCFLQGPEKSLILDLLLSKDWFHIETLTICLYEKKNVSDTQWNSWEISVIPTKNPFLAYPQSSDYGKASDGARWMKKSRALEKAILSREPELHREQLRSNFSITDQYE